MIEIHGPTYRYNGEKLTKPEIMFVNDHCFDEEAHCFHIEKLLENSVCDPKSHTLIFDHILHDDELAEYNGIYFPIFLASECQEFIDQDIEPYWENKNRIFNFSINKPRIHRKFLLEEIERLGLTSYRHSLAWKHNPVNNIPVTDFSFGSEIKNDLGIRNGSFKNAETYHKLLKNIVYQQTCISIITEPCFYEREALITEKTFMAFMGGTIPIWFGGWKNAQAIAALGFDVFEDIVDHSYETLEDPYDRCTQSLERNLHLFDLEKMQKIIADNRHRLQHNVDLLMSNPFLQECFTQVRKSREPLRSSLLQIMPAFRNAMFREQVVEFKWLG